MSRSLSKLLPALLLATAPLFAHGGTAPAPLYSMYGWNVLVGNISTGYADPAELRDAIISTYAAVPHTAWILCGSNLCPVTLYCQAQTSAFSRADFFAYSPPYTDSRVTNDRSIDYTRAGCTALDSSGHVCVAAACVPGDQPVHYAMRASCPSDTVFKDSPARCECRDPGTTWNSVRAACVPYRDRYWDRPDTCFKAGNPIYPLTGVKRQEETSGISIAGVELQLVFDNRSVIPEVNGGEKWLVPSPDSFGALWSSSVHRRLVAQTSGGSFPSVAVQRGAGVWETFDLAGWPRHQSTAGQGNELMNWNGAWTLLDRSALIEEAYNSSGRLTSIAKARGGRANFVYSDASTPVGIAPVPGLLVQVSDSFGRAIGFEYEMPPFGAAPRIKRIVNADLTSIDVTYDQWGNLAKLRWPDGSMRSYLYERSDPPGLLTGIVDESVRRVSSYGYDDQGRALSTQSAGGTGSYSVRFDTPPAWLVTETLDPNPNVNLVWRDHRWLAPVNPVLTDALDNPIALGVVSVSGMPRLASRSQPAGSGCAASASAMAYDDRGNVTRRDDFNGTRTCYAYDTSSRETVRVEGLTSGAQGVDCTSVLGTGSELRAGARKLSAEWHPDWRLARRVAEPGRVTTSVYNGQPDPYAGNALAACAPASAVLPDGKPIAVLCRQVEQATTDADGGQGFSASPEPSVPSREQRWIYNEFGQVLSHDGPRTDVNDITSYAYYGDTTSDHTLGDLKQVTNAAGQVTRHTRYNPNGQVLETVDPNGVVTVYTYDLRQRLTSAAVAGQTTGYDYWPTGLLRRITQPDGGHIDYEYDDAHRLTAVADNLGNRIEYQLDNAGNRIAESVKDPSGGLRRQLTRSIDALGRVQQVTGREQDR